MTDPGAAPIHLDTSFLIRALVPDSPEAVSLFRWIGERRRLAMSAVAWGEFLCGPLSAEDVSAAASIVRTIVSLDASHAALAARLFNQGGRRRGTFQDCLVAATALAGSAPLASSDTEGFRRLVPAGLQILERGA